MEIVKYYKDYRIELHVLLQTIITGMLVVYIYIGW